MEDKVHDSEGLIDKLKEYVQVRKELAILVAVERGSKFLANLFTDGLVLLLGVLAILFGSLALGFYLSEIIGNTYAGFFIIAGFYLLVALVVYLVKDKYLEKRIVDSVISKLLNDKNEDSNEN